MGEFSEGLTVAYEGLDIALSTGLMADLPPALAAVGHVHLLRGDAREALAPLTRAVEVAKDTEFRNWGSICRGLLGLRDVEAGRTDEGVGQLDRVIRLAEEQDERWLQPLFKGWLGEAHLAAGDSESARRHAQVSLEMSRAQSQRGTEAWAWRLLGEIAAVADPPDHQAAKTRYQEALTRASELGMRPLVAHCHLGLGKLYRRTGDGAKAQEHLTTAATMYREMGMTFWLEKADAELGGGQR